jgi:hypothetical protein
MPTISTTSGVRGRLSKCSDRLILENGARIQNGATVAQNGRLSEIVDHENGSHSPRAQELCQFAHQASARRRKFPGTDSATALSKIKWRSSVKTPDRSPISPN